MDQGSATVAVTTYNSGVSVPVTTSLHPCPSFIPLEAKGFMRQQKMKTDTRSHGERRDADALVHSCRGSTRSRPPLLTRRLSDHGSVAGKLLQQSDGLGRSPQRPRDGRLSLPVASCLSLPLGWSRLFRSHKVGRLRHSGAERKLFWFYTLLHTDLFREPTLKTVKPQQSITFPPDDSHQ